MARDATAADFTRKIMKQLELWHGGQFTSVYSLMSSRGNVPVDVVESAITELSRSLSHAKAKHYKGFSRADITDLKNTIDALDYVVTQIRDE